TALNTITNTVQAYVTNSTVRATGGNVALKASETSLIDATSLGGAVALAGGAAAAAAAGAGGSSISNVTNTVEAYISGGAAVSTVSTGNISLEAIDKANVTADTIAASVSVAAGLGAGTFSVGVSIAKNNITNTVRAYSEAST